MATITPTHELLKTELAGVESLLHHYSASEVEVLQEASRHILSAGGKRIRPRIVMLAAQATGDGLERAIRLAAAAELVHTATLVHDDIVDDSDSRRGRSTVQFYFGNSASVLMGDYLVVRAFGIVGDDGDPRLWRILVDTISRMCEGEVLQICIKGDTAISLEVYETIIESKTAILMGACGRFGGIVARATQEEIDALGRYGHHVGMAFQIADDILDFTGNAQSLGKPVGGDLREGKVTLPVIFGLEMAHPEDRDLLLQLYSKPGPLSNADIQLACRILRDSGGFERARDYAMTYVHRALLALEEIPRSTAREALRDLAEHVVDRRA